MAMLLHVFAGKRVGIVPISLGGRAVQGQLAGLPAAALSHCSRDRPGKLPPGDSRVHKAGDLSARYPAHHRRLSDCHSSPHTAIEKSAEYLFRPPDVNAGYSRYEVVNTSC